MKGNMKQPINLDRCRKAIQNLRIYGSAKGRERLLEEAIAQIQKDPTTALKSRYIGMKQYAHFGDQRCDCQYGYGPSHGAIVFSIGRINEESILGDDEIYYLECFRDFGDMHDPEDPHYSLNLGQVIARRDSHEKKLSEYQLLIDSAKVETHTECSNQ